MRRLGIGLLCLQILLAGVPAAMAANSDEQWPQPDETAAGFYSLLLQEDQPGWARHSQLVGNLPNEQLICHSTTDADCARADSFYYQALLPTCSDLASTNCIESVRATTATGDSEFGDFSSYTVPDHPNLFTPNSALGIPKPASASVWRFKHAPHEFGSDYLVVAAIRGTAWPNRMSQPDSFYAYITPVSSRGGDARPVDANGFGNFSTCLQLQDPATGLRKLGCGGNADDFGRYRCATWTLTDCLLKRAFPDGLRMTLKVRLSWEPTGWLHGRMKDPAIQIIRAANGSVSMSVAAQAIGVPTFYSGRMWDALPPVIQDFYTDCMTRNTCGWSSRIARPFGQDPIPQRNVRSEPELFKPQAMTEMALWNELAKDRAAAVPTLWAVRTLSNDELATAGPCLTSQSGLKGIVSTNSTTYSEGPPQFVEGQLRYKVMSPHFNADGSVFRGTYNLLLRSDVARCLYGFSNAPIQASVEVVNEDGTTNVATTVVNEQDGWLSLAAHNFTFSAPTIQVTLKQPVAPKVVITQYITCVKGKTVKKVTAARCPAGFKRK